MKTNYKLKLRRSDAVLYAAFEYGIKQAASVVNKYQQGPWCYFPIPDWYPSCSAKQAANHFRDRVLTTVARTQGKLGRDRGYVFADIVREN